MQESKKEGKTGESKTDMNILPADHEAFSDAVVYGDFDIVVKMVEENQAIIHSTDEYGFTALHNVMCEEQLKTIQYLIDNGADVNQQNLNGIAPLHLACYVENAKILLENGADIELKDDQGNTPLLILASDGEERFEVAEYLISKGASVNAVNNFGRTPLSISESRKDKNMIRLFKNR